jgi:hypothetical protein
MTPKALRFLDHFKLFSTLSSVGSKPLQLVASYYPSHAAHSEGAGNSEDGESGHEAR